MTYVLSPIGIAEDPGEKKKSSLVSFLMAANSVKLDPNVDREQLDVLPHNLLELVREQLVFIPSTANSLYRAARFVRTKTGPYTNTVHVLEFSDSNEVTGIALEQSKNLMDTMGMCKVSGKNKMMNNVEEKIRFWLWYI